MQFFEHQDQAKGRTTLLVALFVIGVLLLVILAGLATHLLLGMNHPPEEPYSLNHLKLVGTASLGTAGVIFFGSIFRLLQLRGGGVTVAETLGGTLIHPTTTELLERRVVNVVEEMAIAAGLPVPPVYLMESEEGINAFAAGWSPDDAVIGVTQGALEGLSRDQLQGVIAHEFSHILNRDCALNMKLMGVLHGIVVISVIGRIVMQMGGGSRHRRSKNDGGVQIVLIGAAIWAFGSIGVLLARVIQAAVSRQREYLADASAVQFTRNPEGIGGALATIGSQSSVLSNPRGAETSHMLIGEPGTAASFFGLASHPPLFDRIKRVMPRWDGDFAAIATPPGSVTAALEEVEDEHDTELPLPLPGSGLGIESELGGGHAGQITGALLGGVILETTAAAPESSTASSRPTHSSPPLIARAANLLQAIPPALREAAEEPFSARGLILAWLLDDDREARTAQLALLAGDPLLVSETERLHSLLATLGPKARLPLFDIAIGTLAGLSEPQRQSFHSHLTQVEAQLSSQAYRSYCLASLALRHTHGAGSKRKRDRLMIKDSIEVVLGVLAVEGQESEEEARAAFTYGTQQLGKRGKKLSLPPRSSLSIHKLDASFETLLRLPTVTRAELLDAAEFVASHDGILKASEAELLRAMATCLGVAAPPAFADE